MKKIIEAALLLAGTAGFFGFIYPELVLTDSGYYYEKDMESYVQNGDTDPCGFLDKYEFLNDSQEFRIRFKIVDYFTKKE